MITTSYFGNLKAIPSGLEPISIARGAPRNYKGRRFYDLAPTWAMLKLPRSEYDRQYDAILDRLNAHEVVEQLGESAVLLCWEKPGFWCHRRRVAEWLELELEITVPELGFEHAEALSYGELPEAP